MELVIGDKAWSSWSMRPWLVLKRAAIPFTETVVRLRREDTAAAIAQAGSPSGQVPLLRTDDGLVIWDSLAISEWAAEHRPAAGLWPSDPRARALARSAACEMHAGFPALRAELSVDLTLRTAKAVSPAAGRDLRRVAELWSEMRGRFGADGPFLFGRWSIADAFFTPVATRLRTYDVDLRAHGDADGRAGAYAAELLDQPEILEWERGV